MNDVELKVCLARLDERLKALRDDIAHNEAAGLRALDISTTALNKRMDDFTRFNIAVDERLKVVENYNSQLTGKQWIGGAVILIIAAAVALAVQMMLKG